MNHLFVRLNEISKFLPKMDKSFFDLNCYQFINALQNRNVDDNIVRDYIRFHSANRFRAKRGRNVLISDADQEKLLLVVAGDLARRRLARGLQLNYPESLALISCELLEGARDGRSVAELMIFGTTILNSDQVMEGVETLLDEVQIEATFADGTKLVTVHNPISRPNRAT